MKELFLVETHGQYSVNGMNAGAENHIAEFALTEADKLTQSNYSKGDGDFLYENTGITKYSSWEDAVRNCPIHSEHDLDLIGSQAILELAIEDEGCQMKAIEAIIFEIINNSNYEISLNENEIREFFKNRYSL